MGMYTELVLGIDLVEDTPAEVIDILEYMMSGTFEDPEPITPDHPLFKTDRWRTMLQSDSYYFGGFSNSLISAPRFVYTDDGNDDDFEIIRDVETGVLYILYNDCFGHYGGLSPLYDSDGNIVVEED